MLIHTYYSQEEITNLCWVSTFMYSAVFNVK